MTVPANKPENQVWREDLCYIDKQEDGSGYYANMLGCFFDEACSADTPREAAEKLREQIQYYLEKYKKALRDVSFYLATVR